MLRLHHLNNSRSQRILWLLEELELDYQLISYQRDAKTQLAPESLAKIHPLGKSPILVDQELIIAESAAIIEYLVDTYAKEQLRPDANKHSLCLDYRYWMHYTEGSLMPMLLLNLVFHTVKSSPMPFFVKPIAKAIVNKVSSSFIQPNIKRHLTFIENHLSDRQWLLGEQLSGADFQMSFPLEAAIARGVITDKYPHICAYVRRLQARAAYRRALAKGGVYDYAAT